MTKKHPKMELLYDPEKDVLEVNGVEVTGELVRFLADSLSFGRIFRVMPGADGRRLLEEMEYDDNLGLSLKKERVL